MYPQIAYIRLTEWQQRAINAIAFNNNYMIIAQDVNGKAFLDLNISDELLQDGLKSMCQENPQLLDMLTDLVIDLHTEKK
jgi:hypothetical protein